MGTNRIAEKGATAAEGRLAFLEAEQAKDRASIDRLQQAAKQGHQNILVRAGRIDELKRTMAQEAGNGR